LKYWNTTVQLKSLRIWGWGIGFIFWCVFAFRVSSSVLTRSCLYGGWGSGGGGPRSGCWWGVDGAAGPTAGRHGGAHCWCLSLLLGLEGLSTDVMVLLPVLMLAKWAAVSCCVATTAGFTSFPATVPATLEAKEEGEKCKKLTCVLNFTWKTAGREPLVNLLPNPSLGAALGGWTCSTAAPVTLGHSGPQEPGRNKSSYLPVPAMQTLSTIPRPVTWSWLTESFSKTSASSSARFIKTNNEACTQTQKCLSKSRGLKEDKKGRKRPSRQVRLITPGKLLKF